MTDLLLPGGAVATVIAIVLGWIFGGNIRSTDADKLWEEAGLIREEYKAQIRDQADEIHAMKKRIATLESERSTDRRWKQSARSIMQECADGNPVLREKIHEMQLLELS